MKTKLPLVALLLCFGGCAPTNLSEIITAAAHDPAMVHAQVVTPWGTATYDRNKLAN